MQSEAMGPAILPNNGPSRQFHSLAVLPFTNVETDLNAEYLCDGITESIITSLSQLSQLRVMAYSTVFRYKGMTPIREKWVRD